MRQESKLSILGLGPGSRQLMTRQAALALQEAEIVVGYRPYLDLISDLLEGKRVVSSGMGGEVERAKAAADLLEEGSVALVSSGDPNVYGMAGLGLEVLDDLNRAEVVPGVTAFTAASCWAGITFRRSVAVVSLSDLLTPWTDIERRLRLTARLGMPTALYNPKSKRRDWQLDRALEIFGEKARVLVARMVGRPGQEIFWSDAREILAKEETRAKIDMFTLLILSGQGMAHIPAAEEAPINVVGIGPAAGDQLTLEAERLLEGSAIVLGAKRYLEMVRGSVQAQMISHDSLYPDGIASRLKEAQAVAERGERAAILTGGDPSIFSAAWRYLQGLEGSRGSQPHVAPGVSAFSAVASRAGAPLVNDFALLSRLEPQAAALSEAGFGVVIYNLAASELPSLLNLIEPTRPCLLARDVGREGEFFLAARAGDLLEARVLGSRFTFLVSSASSYLKEGRIIARRGYQTKYGY
jgi:precorrin-3B C17-methyltransferase